MSQLASVPYSERMTLALAAGQTGLSILKDYGIRTGELDYFVNFAQTSLSTEFQHGGFSPILLSEELRSSIAELAKKITLKVGSLKGELTEREIDDLSSNIGELIAILQRAVSISYAK